MSDTRPIVTRAAFAVAASTALSVGVAVARLMIGHSETLYGIRTNPAMVAPSVYQRSAG